MESIFVKGFEIPVVDMEDVISEPLRYECTVSVRLPYVWMNHDFDIFHNGNGKLFAISCHDPFEVSSDDVLEYMGIYN